MVRSVQYKQQRQLLRKADCISRAYPIAVKTATDNCRSVFAFDEIVYLNDYQSMNCLRSDVIQRECEIEDSAR